jgi:parallel beta-helix repeat protein
MNFKNALAAAVLAACTIYSSHAFAQASVVENEPKAIYVNAASGNDINPGTAVQPTQTIQAALNKAITSANAGVGAKIMIAPGTYHESLNVNSTGQGTITIQASTLGTAVIDGADVVTGWSKASTGVYSAHWADTVGGCPLPANWYTGMPPVVQANEMVFVNGALMAQVMSSSQLRPGTFYVNKGSSQVQLYPPSGTNMSTANVEIASRRSVLTTSGKNLVFRGLSFQHAASCMNDNAVTVTSGSNVLFDSDTAEWNNWGGIGVNGSTGVTVENTTADYNGGSGLSGFQDTNSTWSNNETDFNNWRGSMVGLYDFANGGLKLGRVRTATITSQKSYYNASQGLWFDTDNENVTINGAKLDGNMVGNLQLEASQGPFLVENSNFCNGAGIQILNSSGITFSGNTFYNNGGTSFQNGQLFLAGNAAGRSFTNWTTHQSMTTWTTGMKLQNNNFVAVGSGQYVFNTYTSGSQWSKFVSSLSSNNNHWYNSSSTSDFVLPGNSKTTLSGWRSSTHQDSSSTWASASASCGAPASVYADFQLLAHNAASYVASYTMSGGKLSIPLQLRSFNYGTVTLSASGLPSGVSASFSSSSLASGNSTLTLTASKSAASQTALITIFGTSGSRVHAITLKVNVRPS